MKDGEDLINSGIWRGGEGDLRIASPGPRSENRWADGKVNNGELRHAVYGGGVSELSVNRQ